MARSVKPHPVRAATLADVGRAAGVSAMAASTVLNGARTSSRISPATRERILQAAAALRYRPNAAARALAHRRMNTIGVAATIETSTGDLNLYFLETFNGILAAAALREQTTTVLALHDWRQDVHRLASFCDGRVDGVIMMAPRLPAELAGVLPTHTPFVSIHSNATLPGVINLESDEETGAYEAVRHLIANGHRRIIHLSGDRESLGAQRRIRGYRRALAAARIRFDPSLVLEANFNRETAREALGAWLRNRGDQPLPDAIFAVNDSVGVAALELLAEAGLRVPHDVAIVGFDDTITTRTTVPQLSTVRQPLRAMGARAVEVLCQRIEEMHAGHRSTDTSTIVFPTELIARASSAPTSPRPAAPSA